LIEWGREDDTEEKHQEEWDKYEIQKYRDLKEDK
jgi:hypothetical protein